MKKCGIVPGAKMRLACLNVGLNTAGVVATPREPSARVSGGQEPRKAAAELYFILQLLYDVMDIPFGGAGFCDGE